MKRVLGERDIIIGMLCHGMPCYVMPRVACLLTLTALVRRNVIGMLPRSGCAVIPSCYVMPCMLCYDGVDGLTSTHQPRIGGCKQLQVDQPAETSDVARYAKVCTSSKI